MSGWVITWMDGWADGQKDDGWALLLSNPTVTQSVGASAFLTPGPLV